MGNKASTREEKSPNYDLFTRHFESHSKEHGGQNLMSSENFQECLGFPEPVFCELLFNHLSDQDVKDSVDGKQQLLGRDHFIQAMEGILEMEGDDTIIAEVAKYYFAVFSRGADTVTKDGLRDLLNVCMSTTLAVSCIELDSAQSQAVQSMGQSMMTDSQNLLSKEAFCRWIVQNSPRLFTGVQAWLHRALFKIKPQWCPVLPLLSEPCQESRPVLNYDMLWSLSTVIPLCYLKSQKPPVENSSDSQSTQAPALSSWTLLYSSHEHGQSMNRFKHHCLSYRGPTVTMLSVDRDTVLAVCVDTEWKDSTEGWGGNNCMLVQICPEFKVLQNGAKMMFLNEKARGIPTGLGVGAPLSKPKIFIQTDMSSAKLNYQQRQADIRNIEVWGCGGQEAEAAQKRQQIWERKQAEKMRKVKLPGQWDENPDKAILEMAGITTSHAQR